MKFQLHWQNEKDLKDTIFVRQFEAVTVVDVPRMNDMIRETIKNRMEERPESWAALVCSENSQYFDRNWDR